MTWRAVTMLALVGAVTVGAAAPADAEDVAVTGTLDVAGTYDIGACDLVWATLDGTGDWVPVGPVAIHLEYCLQVPVDPFAPYPIHSGSFTVTAADGTLTGDVGGELLGAFPGPDGRHPVRLDLAVTGGTGAYAGATGAITVTGGAGLEPLDVRTVVGTVAGSFTLPEVHTPASLRDCTRQGWRQHTDENGVPFPSMRACVRWVQGNR